MPKEGWVIWYEDASGPGDLGIYLSEQAAKKRTSELLLDLVGDLEEEAGPKEWEPEDTFTPDARKVTVAIRAEIDSNRVWEAHAIWEDFLEEYGPSDRGHVRVERATIYE
jgi:hypothetical protein